MATHGFVFIVAAAYILLAPRAQARNDAPCQRSKWNNGYNTFIKRHVRSGLPASLDSSEWRNYIKNNGGCDRPTQSFLDPKDLDRIRAVCSNRGGKTYKDNLCISQEPFSFVTVRSDHGTCGIKNIVRESKHLILACEVLENQCLPVHFEGNPKDARPSNNAKGCLDPDIKGHASRLKTTQMCWLASVFVFMYAYFY
ncbi:angiogenin-2-like [Stigmatopora argus]